MASETSALKFCKAEEKDFEQLMNVVAKVLRDGDSLHAEKYDMNKWRWKYYVMAYSEPRIYICKEGEEIIGYYHCPVYRGTVNGVAKKFAMVQDVGMSEAARGKGVFSKLATYATNDLKSSDINVLYTFPNDKSIHTFIKYNGYSKIQTLSTFILPVKFGNIIAAKIKLLGIEKLIGGVMDGVYSLKTPSLKNKFSIKLEEKITPEIVEVFLDFGKRFKITLTRDYDYLHWRFEQKPHGKHYFFTASEGEKIVAVAVISVEDLLGSKAAVIIDFAVRGDNDEAFAQLINHIRKNYKNYFDEPIGMFYTSTISNNETLFKKAGFIKIPERINPRALHLLGNNVSENENVLDAGNWNITLSEWDVL
ncbi:MAG: GNAT family N-acetyltransferase [Bacteroidia bacterium]